MPPTTNSDGAPVSARFATSTDIAGNVKETDELAAVIEELLDGLTVKFNKVSEEIFGKMDEMSRRLDDLEASILANADASKAS